MENINNKLEKLNIIINKYNKISIAYSGGIDSSLLLKLTYNIKKEKVIAIIVKTIFTIKEDILNGVDFCRNLNINYKLIELDFNNEEFDLIKKNPLNRCYLCKKIIFKYIIEEANKTGYNTIFDGSNYSDLDDFRPGKKALLEYNIISPLYEAGLTKEEIRIIAKKENIDFFDKVSNSCLLTRIPYDNEITIKKIQQIEKSENYLKNLGFKIVRVRHFDDFAIIEVGKQELKKMFSEDLLNNINRELLSYGFLFVTLNIEGYKTGNINKFYQEYRQIKHEMV